MSATGTLSLAMPIPVGFEGFHLYAQGLFLGTAGGGATMLLDSNIQN